MSREDRDPPKLLGDPATVLPKELRDALVTASQIKNPLSRTAQIDHLTARGKRHYPHLFRKD